jgi:hypothetical protein
MKTLAQNLDFGKLEGFGPLGEGQGDASVSTFSKFISSTVGLLTIVAFIWFVFIFITGAIGIISSGGDKQALEAARKRIINGLIGVVVVIGAISIISLIGFLLGIDILNIPALFNQIQ